MRLNHGSLRFFRISQFNFPILTTIALSAIVFSCHNEKEVNTTPVGAFAPVAILSANGTLIETQIAVSSCIPGHTISCQTYFGGIGTGVIPVAGSGNTDAICSKEGTILMTVSATGTFQAGDDACNSAFALCTDVNTYAPLQTISICSNGPVATYLAGATCTYTIISRAC